MKSLVPAAAAAVSVLMGAAVGLSMELPTGERGPTAIVAAPPVAVAPDRSDPYTIYLVDDQAEAEAVREWLLYGEALVVTPENEEMVADAIEHIGGIKQGAGVEIEIVDFRGD